MRKLAPSGETITLAAADPLNLVGILVPGDRVPAISGRTVSFRDGVAEQALSVGRPEPPALESAG
jgi:ATP-dependent Lhr-like helicase